MLSVVVNRIVGIRLELDEAALLLLLLQPKKGYFLHQKSFPYEFSHFDPIPGDRSDYKFILIVLSLFGGLLQLTPRFCLVRDDILSRSLQSSLVPCVGHKLGCHLLNHLIGKKRGVKFLRVWDFSQLFVDRQKNMKLTTHKLLSGM